MPGYNYLVTTERYMYVHVIPANIQLTTLLKFTKTMYNFNLMKPE